MNWYNEKKYTKWYAAISLFLLTGAFIFHNAAVKEDSAIVMYRVRNEAAALYTAAGPHPEQREPSFFPAADFYALRDHLGESGAVITSVTEEMPEPLKMGQILKMKCTGRGSFYQLLSLLNIVQSREYWVTAVIHHAERKGGELQFEIELSAYQAKGKES